MNESEQTARPGTTAGLPPIVGRKEADLSTLEALRSVHRPLYLVREEHAETIRLETRRNSLDGTAVSSLAGMVAPCPLECLGDPTFCRDHGLRYAYVGGSMAKGISSTAMVKALGQAGMLGFFGAAGLQPAEVAAAIDALQAEADAFPFGVNLIHSPNEPPLENALVDLFLERNIRLVEASAFLGLTLPVVRYRTHGIHRDAQGRIVVPNRLVAKISREEVASRFCAPPPEKLLRELVAAGDLSEAQAELAAQVPMAQDITVEADSGGHTDNRPALALFPTIAALRDRLQQQHAFDQPLRVGLGGGIATPAAAAAGFALGAAYLVTGSVNQACLEAGTCEEVRRMLAETRQADVTMAPSGDMFEMGVKVQVLKRGTMFSMRAAKLYELYRGYDSIEALPIAERQKLEKTIFRMPLEAVWSETQRFFQERDPRQLIKAEKEPKYKMALIFRWYLGLSPVWANQGDASRRIDYQVWCGPAMGAFNEWARDSFLQDAGQRDVATVALNILFGAAVTLRANQMSMQGLRPDQGEALTRPLPADTIKEYLR
ncbi:MAG TPA: PfaD family polyunsaturated fatty acid/polyketide biosynthesis protein [Desulfuromonadales bacterium]|nr:PfaD family polyunsaturated fatty acid/polyketide biosynthesis protein [Desulfuromonadales bacterium]